MLTEVLEFCQPHEDLNGDLDGGLGLLLWPGSIPLVSIWRVNQWMEGLSFSFKLNK